MILLSKLLRRVLVWNIEELALLIIYLVMVQARIIFSFYALEKYFYLENVLGVLTAIPWGLFNDFIDPTSVVNIDGSIASAVAMMFLPK